MAVMCCSFVSSPHTAFKYNFVMVHIVMLLSHLTFRAVVSACT